MVAAEAADADVVADAGVDAGVDADAAAAAARAARRGPHGPLHPRPTRAVRRGGVCAAGWA